MLQTSRYDMMMAWAGNGRVEESITELLRKRMGSWIWMPHVILSGVTFS